MVCETGPSFETYKSDTDKNYTYPLLTEGELEGNLSFQLKHLVKGKASKIVVYRHYKGAKIKVFIQSVSRI